MTIDSNGDNINRPNINSGNSAAERLPISTSKTKKQGLNAALVLRPSYMASAVQMISRAIAIVPGGSLVSRCIISTASHISYYLGMEQRPILNSSELNETTDPIPTNRQKIKISKKARDAAKDRAVKESIKAENMNKEKERKIMNQARITKEKINKRAEEKEDNLLPTNETISDSDSESQSTATQASTPSLMVSSSQLVAIPEASLTPLKTALEQRLTLNSSESNETPTDSTAANAQKGKKSRKARYKLKVEREKQETINEEAKEAPVEQTSTPKSEPEPESRPQASPAHEPVSALVSTQKSLVASSMVPSPLQQTEQEYAKQGAKPKSSVASQMPKSTLETANEPSTSIHTVPKTAKILKSPFRFPNPPAHATNYPKHVYDIIIKKEKILKEDVRKYISESNFNLAYEILFSCDIRTKDFKLRRVCQNYHWCCAFFLLTLTEGNPNIQASSYDFKKLSTTDIATVAKGHIIAMLEYSQFVGISLDSMDNFSYKSFSRAQKFDLTTKHLCAILSMLKLIYNYHKAMKNDDIEIISQIKKFIETRISKQPDGSLISANELVNISVKSLCSFTRESSCMQNYINYQQVADILILQKHMESYCSSLITDKNSSSKCLLYGFQGLAYSYYVTGYDSLNFLAALNMVETGLKHVNTGLKLIFTNNEYTLDDFGLKRADITTIKHKRFELSEFLSAAGHLCELKISLTEKNSKKQKGVSPQTQYKRHLFNYATSLKPGKSVVKEELNKIVVIDKN